MMYDRILHLTTVVAIVMTVWARSAVTHRVFSAWLHPLRGEGCASGWGLPSRHFRHLQSGQLPWSEPLHHLKGWVIYLTETWCAKETENVIFMSWRQRDYCGTATDAWRGPCSWWSSQSRCELFMLFAVCQPLQPLRKWKLLLSFSPLVL